MSGMSTFDESKIRRGQPDNAGQFTNKTSTPPAGSLTQPAGKPIHLPDGIENEGIELDTNGYEYAWNVGVTVDPFDEDIAETNVNVFDDLLWRGDFTEEELDEHYEIVEDVYRTHFGGYINVPDSWDNIDVTLRRSIPREGLTEEAAHEAAWESYAKWLNETDPGTFGSPYIGTELRRRIDVANEARQS